MKQIKTIRRADPADFDKDVNQAIAGGWTLDKRYLSDVGFVAELEREVFTEEEQCCENCAHLDKSSNMEPCRSCSDDCDLWEAVT